MVSKNNLQHKLAENARHIPHYGLRKLSVGVASVLLSTTLYFGATAHAATDAPASNDQEPADTTDQTTDTSAENKIQQPTVKIQASQQTNQHEEANSNAESDENSTSEQELVLNQNNLNSTANSDELTASLAENISTDPDFVIPANQDANVNKNLVGTGTTKSVTLEYMEL